MCTWYNKTLEGKERVDLKRAREEHTYTVTEQAKAMPWVIINHGPPPMCCSYLQKTWYCCNKHLNAGVRSAYHQTPIVNNGS